MQFQNNKERILIIDFGSQVPANSTTDKRNRCIFRNYNTKKVFKIKDYNKIKGIIFSGGPQLLLKKISKCP